VKKLKDPPQPIRRNIATARADARPTADLNLTQEEIAMLPHPDWVLGCLAISAVPTTHGPNLSNRI
jgi:hypothetical protein